VPRPVSACLQRRSGLQSGGERDGEPLELPFRRCLVDRRSSLLSMFNVPKGFGRIRWMKRGDEAMRVNVGCFCLGA